MNNIILNIRDYLKQISSAKDQSITRLISSLEKRDGFGRIQLLNNHRKPIVLSIEHDPGIIRSQQIFRITRKLANNLNRIFGHLLVKISDLYNTNYPKPMPAFSKKCAGVTNVFADPHGWIDLEFNRYITEEARLIKCINQNR